MSGDVERLIPRLTKLAEHLERLDSESGEAKLLRETVAFLSVGAELLAALELALPMAEGCYAEHYGDNPEGGPVPRHIDAMRTAIAKARSPAPTGASHDAHYRTASCRTECSAPQAD